MTTTPQGEIHTLALHLLIAGGYLPPDPASTHHDRELDRWRMRYRIARAQAERILELAHEIDQEDGS